MKNRSRDPDQLRSQLKRLVADLFRLDILDPETIAAEEPIMGGSLGLDSLDVIELAICIEEEFGIAVCGGDLSRITFGSIASLANFIDVRAQGSAVRPDRPAAGRIPQSVGAG